jgi:hypothetical protein
MTEIHFEPQDMATTVFHTLLTLASLLTHKPLHTDFCINVCDGYVHSIYIYEYSRKYEIQLYIWLQFIQCKNSKIGISYI